MVIFAINGKARRGKNTFANLLVGSYICLKNEDPYNCQILAFADPIKEIALKMYPQAKRECLFGPSELRDEKIPGTSISYRNLLMDIGKFGRKDNINIWANNLVERMQISHASFITIPDLRFKHEVKSLQKLNNIKLIRIKREIKEELSNQNDISEIDLDSMPDDNFDYIIDNNSDLENLRIQAEKVIKSIV